MDIRIDKTGMLAVEFDTGLRRKKRRKQAYMKLRKAGVKHGTAVVIAKFLSYKIYGPHGKMMCFTTVLGPESLGKKTMRRLKAEHKEER